MARTARAATGDRTDGQHHRRAGAENPTARSKRPRHEWPINSGLDDDGLELLRRILAAYFEYRSTAMQGDLRRYLFRLEEGRYPAADAVLPAL